MTRIISGVASDVAVPGHGTPSRSSPVSDAYTKLAMAVLWRSLLDYHVWQAHPEGVAGKNLSISPHDGRSARQWLLGISKPGLSFEVVATVLGFDPAWLAARCLDPAVGEAVTQFNPGSRGGLRGR